MCLCCVFVCLCCECGWVFRPIWESSIETKSIKNTFALDMDHLSWQMDTALAHLCGHSRLFGVVVENIYVVYK